MRRTPTKYWRATAHRADAPESRPHRPPPSSDRVDGPHHGAIRRAPEHRRGRRISTNPHRVHAPGSPHGTATRVAAPTPAARVSGSIGPRGTSAAHVRRPTERRSHTEPAGGSLVRSLAIREYFGVVLQQLRVRRLPRAGRGRRPPERGGRHRERAGRPGPSPHERHELPHVPCLRDDVRASAGAAPPGRHSRSVAAAQSVIEVPEAEPHSGSARDASTTRDRRAVRE
jgi:hypothetical protein